MACDRYPNKGMSLLALDIGRGTQDILVYRPDQPIENSTKLVLPSPAIIVANKIIEATRQEKPIFLTGRCMGGGANVQALSRHVRAGLPVYATPAAAATIHDNPARVTAMGIAITESLPREAFEIATADYMERELRTVMELFDVPYPEHLAFAVQDHGFSPEKSNRVFRFEVMRAALDRGEWEISALIHDPPLPAMTRMHAVLEQAPGALVIDTGPAAVLGVLCDPVVREHARNGVTLVNAGNGHTLCVSLKGEEVCGIFEHHTAALDRKHLLALIQRLQNGSLREREIFDEGGHGAAVNRPLPATFIAVTGPNRKRLLPDAYHAAPYGDMMLSGCFGLLSAWKKLRGHLP